MVQQEIRLTEEEDRHSRAVGMGGQCPWTRCKTTDWHLTWADIWHYEPLWLKILLRLVYDLLPSPANLHRWGLVEDQICHLCDKPGNMQHAISMSTCQTAIAQGGYRWRHDTVLGELADILERDRRKKRNTKKKALQAINVVEEDQTGNKTKATTTWILDEFDCWEMKVNLGKLVTCCDCISHIKKENNSQTEIRKHNVMQYVTACTLSYLLH